MERARAIHLLKRGGLPAALAVYLLLGVYSVGSDESGVAYRLGRAVGRDVLPGIHWNPPWPFGSVSVAKTTTNFSMPVGFRSSDEDGSGVSDLWLTGDTNIIRANVNFQYRIRSLADYELSHEDPRELLRREGERVLTRFMAGQQVDEALTTARERLRARAQREVQAALDRERTGIEIQAVNIQDLAPPQQGGVRRAFQEVQNARSDRERVLLEAAAYRAQVLAKGRGDAERLRSEAQAARHRRVTLAHGERERFAALAREHARAPEVTEERLYLESLERLLPELQTYVVEPNEGGKVNLRVVR